MAAFFMVDRLKLLKISSEPELINEVYAALKELTNREPQVSPSTQVPLVNCCKTLVAGGAAVMMVQTRVQDPDFLAEFSAYYSRQFLNVPRFCTRLHFFRHPVDDGKSVLDYLDEVPKDTYLGFITLRPVIKSPIGASILSISTVPGFLRCIDQFPVNIAGAEFTVAGTPFMQQDNAVGACAQASIWMALRTLRKREGDRAYDPAQITDAATKYFVSGRIRPNRQGLTQLQMIEAIRAAGYSPHMIPLGSWYGTAATAMTKPEVHDSMKTIHAYIESEIPVILILFPPSGGHAVVAIGHTWDEAQPSSVHVGVNLRNGLSLRFLHAISWVPSFLIHNDNTGPYRPLLETNPTDYAFEHAAYAIPLLPIDVFMSGEEASTIAIQILAEIFQGFKDGGLKTDAELEALAESLTLRLLLVEKRKLRKWAATEQMVPELKEQLRLMDMPKRVWVLEIHEGDKYGAQNINVPQSLVGVILIDPTADIPPMSMLLMHFNLPALVGLQYGVLVTWDAETGGPSKAFQTNDNGPTRPIRI